MNAFKTQKGTELPILQLKGKDYLEVKYRLVWFREEHPDWSIETDLISVTDKSALSRAIVRDSSGRLIATGHKFENQSGFPDFIEKAETGSIGRALALCGYGTQFTDDMEEGERVVDSPVARTPSKPPAAPVAPVASIRPRANPSPEQIKRLFTIADKHKVSDDALRVHMGTHFKDFEGKPLTSTKDLSIPQYDRLVLDIKDGRINKEPGADG